MKKRTLREPKARVKRLVDPPYAAWVEGAINPKLTGSGPAEVDPEKLQLWHPPAAKPGELRTGQWIYLQLEKADLLERCLGLRDLFEIKRKGIAFYRKHFHGNTVFGWKSVVRDRLGFLYVPYLFEFGDGVEVHWYLLEWVWERTTVSLLL